MITLKRIAQIEDATYGVLLDDGLPFALSLERAWKNNEVGKSCIPKGTYICKRVQSPKFGDTFEVTGVPGRSAILFHKGNINDDSHGCILVGEQFNPVLGKNGIVASAEGFTEFLRRLSGLQQFTLTIVEV